MTNVLFQVSSGEDEELITIYDDGTFMLEFDQTNFLILDLEYVARQVGKAYKMMDQQEHLAELVGLTSPGTSFHLVEPVVQEEPLPLTQVSGVVFQGPSGPEVLVDMIQELQDLTERNAQLRKQLETLEEIRSGLEGML